MGKDQELLEAARNGNIPVVEKILSQRAKRSGPLASLRRGPGANVQDASGYSALHHAALNGHREVVELLLTHEASTNIVDVKGSSPLHLAAWTGNEDIVRLLLCHGPSVPNVNLTTKDSETALHCAAQYGHTGVVSQLLEHSCDPSIRNSRQETALDLAAQYGRLETVELLVRTHPELIEPYSTRSGAVFPHTPLHLASRNGHRAVVGVLLAAGMDVNARTAAGTALHEAAMYGKLEVVRTLLAAGVDVRARDQRRHTVMELLGQFPAHVTHDIAAIISRHRDCVSDADDLPPIPVPDPSGLGSPYENVRTSGRRASPASSPGTSPTHWHFYHAGTPEERRVSGHSNASVGSEGGGMLFQTPPPPPKSLPDSFLSAEEGDQISVSSSSSLYMPMGGTAHTKVSPTPPKKPPRRNLSVSPTHIAPPPLMSVSADGGVGVGGGSYEYLYLARSGRSHGDLRRGRSADQYVDMRPPVAVLTTSAPPHEGGFVMRTQNPRRKLRRSNHDYENYDFSAPTVTVATVTTSVPAPADRERRRAEDVQEEEEEEAKFVSSAYITLRSSQESLLDESGAAPPLSPTHYQQPPTPDHPPPSALHAERSIHERIRPLSQEYKRRSRDMETETEEELLVFPSLDASSGSLSSSVSLSDKSVSTDNNVEEFLADAPFAGLYKGSTAQGVECGQRAERPRTLRRLRSVYDQPHPQGQATLSNNGKAAMSDAAATTDRSSSLSILSPFDEQEEWAKISEIMASFGTGLVRESVFVADLEKEFQARLGLHSPVGQWLATLGLADYENMFLKNGYDDLDFINGVLEEGDLKEMGVDSDRDRETLLRAAKELPCRVARRNSTVDQQEDVDAWLASLRLQSYSETFRKHLYTDMARVRRVWEVELSAVLDISRVGHRRRILASVGGGRPPDLHGLSADLDQLKSNIQALKDEIREKLPVSGTQTLGRQHRKARPAPPPPPAGELCIRDPAQLLVGVPSAITTTWRHRPHALVSGAVTYVANYLGSTLVKELRGTESTKKSIQKLKKATKEPKTTPDIVLSISYRGVKFFNTLTQELVCEHEIRNIHCACQDADDLTHFAYITKDHSSRSHYCHVFCVSTMDQATEVILTLGQAFEVAYQIALRDQLTPRNHNNNNNNVTSSTAAPSGGNNGNGHARTQSAATSKDSTSTLGHSRSHSVNDIKLNGAEAAPIVLTEEL